MNGHIQHTSTSCMHIVSVLHITTVYKLSWLTRIESTLTCAHLCGCVFTCASVCSLVRVCAHLCGCGLTCVGVCSFVWVCSLVWVCAHFCGCGFTCVGVQLLLTFWSLIFLLLKLVITFPPPLVLQLGLQSVLQWQSMAIGERMLKRLHMPLLDLCALTYVQ